MMERGCASAGVWITKDSENKHGGVRIIRIQSGLTTHRYIVCWVLVNRVGLTKYDIHNPNVHN